MWRTWDKKVKHSENRTLIELLMKQEKGSIIVSTDFFFLISQLDGKGFFH